MPEFTCLFCGKTFTEREVLFANEITSAMSTAPDGTLREYYSRFTSAPTTIPTQLLYHWTDLPPDNITFSEGESIPSTIYIHCRSVSCPRWTLKKALPTTAPMLCFNPWRIGAMLSLQNPPARRRTTINCCKFCSVRLTRTFICGLTSASARTATAACRVTLSI